MEFTKIENRISKFGGKRKLIDDVKLEQLISDFKFRPVVVEALRSMLVEGKTWSKTSEETGLNAGTIKRAIDRVTKPVSICPCCGQKIKNLRSKTTKPFTP